MGGLSGLSVLVVGGGAREHAISQAYEASPQVERIIASPGNGFMGYRRGKEVLIEKGCDLRNPSSILEIAERYRPGLVDVAQDDALAAGTTDLLREKGFEVFGPSRASARIEWDKRWSREFMQRHEIPHPPFRYFDSGETANEYVRELYGAEPSGVVYVKAAGLCAGKGALRSANLDEAISNIRRMGEFGDAGRIFLIEEAMKGEEFSFYAVSDGRTYRLLKSAQDNKTLLNFDEGEQTGGMGAISPAMVTEPVKGRIEELLISKAIAGLAAEGHPYRGILYLGGIVAGGEPMNIEYNARWGDPECQVVLPSVRTDYVDIATACMDGRLGNLEIEQDGRTRVCVVGASRGYPNDYSAARGKKIHGLGEAMEMEGITVLGAGIAMRDGRFYADGGRLFSVVSEGNDIVEARQRAYSAIAHINVEGNNLHYRTDIGWRDAERFLEGI